MSGDSEVDEYQRSAENVDVMLAEPWQVMGPLVVAGLDGFGPGQGPVVDIGAGTGRGVVAVARALPDAQIVAVEPSAVMRAVLMARVGADDDLRRRVTVVDGDAASARLPERFGAVVAMNMIGHLDRAARTAFWAMLASRLVPGGPAVVNLPPPTEAVAVPETAMAEVAVGRRTYQGSGRAEPDGTDKVIWHVTYRTIDDGVAVSDERVSYAWWVLAEPGLRAELAEAGLAATRIGPADAPAYVVTHEDHA